MHFNITDWLSCVLHGLRYFPREPREDKHVKHYINVSYYAMLSGGPCAQYPSTVTV